MKTKCLLICICFSVAGCKTSHVKSGKPALSLVEPITKQFCLEDIPEAKYTVKVKNKLDQEEQMEFVWPWYAAIGGRIQNESGVFERAAAGQIDQSMVVGMATRKYFLWSGHRAKAIRVAMRDTTDWNEVRKILLEVAGEGNILAGLTPLPTEVIQRQVLRQNIPPEFFITGSLTEVTVAEESVAAGFNFAGIGASGKIVQTSVAGSLEITDPYTGELVISVMGQNRITAEQVGAEGFRIVSFGGDQEYLNVELSTAKEMIKQQVQVELVDYLFYKAFKELIENKPGYLTNRLHYRVGRIQGYAQELATQKGLTVIDTVVPIPVKIPTEPEYIERIEPESAPVGVQEQQVREKDKSKPVSSILEKVIGEIPEGEGTGQEEVKPEPEVTEPSSQNTLDRPESKPVLSVLENVIGQIPDFEGTEQKAIVQK